MRSAGFMDRVVVMRSWITYFALALLAIAAPCVFADDGGDSGGDDGGASSGGASAGGVASAPSGDGSSGGGDSAGLTEHDFLRCHQPLEFAAAQKSGAESATTTVDALTEQAMLAGLQAPLNNKTLTAVASSTAAPVVPTVVQMAVERPMADDGVRYHRMFSDTQDDVAVIIENAHYRERVIPENRAAVNDAKFFKRFATDALGIADGNILYVKDATKAQLLKVFGSEQQPHGQLADWIRPGKSRVYVYYAGHGAPSQGGNSFLIPSDADSTYLELSGYSVATLYNNLATLPAKHASVILESCFSGVSQAGSIITNASPLFLKPKASTPPSKITVISAAKLNQIASWEQSEPRSLFTKYFLRAMSGAADQAPYGNGDGQIAKAELSRYLGDTLSYWARRYYGRDQQALIQNWGMQ